MQINANSKERKSTLTKKLKTSAEKRDQKNPQFLSTFFFSTKCGEYNSYIFFDFFRWLFRTLSEVHRKTVVDSVLNTRLLL